MASGSASLPRLYYGARASEASLCADNEQVFVVVGNSDAQAAMHFSR